MPFPNEQIRAFLDGAPDAIVIVDGSGRLVLVNSETEAMFQYSRAELIGQPVEMLLPERLRARHRDHVIDYSAAPRRRPMGAGLELYGLRRDGAEFPVEISLSPVAVDDERYVTGAIRDVTARKAVERALVEARQFAEQENRAKSAFLAAASHDLRQPLQTLTLLSNVLTRAAPMDSNVARAVANQSEALHLMAELLNSLLDISKLEAGVIEPDITDVSVARIFERLRAEFATLAEAKGLELIVEDCNTVVRTDPALLGQIIQNLIGNAIRYTRNGCVSLRCLAAPNTARIEVLDTGVGIPADELESIFDEFYQSRTGHAHEGVGLGLSIARRTADLLGCLLDVSSTPGKGSRFSVTVPRGVSEARSEGSAARAATTKSLPEDLLVVVIDDDEAVANATAMLLGSLGIECVTAPGSAKALEALENRQESSRLLICDFHLGDRECGTDVIRTIREWTGSELPAILLSGDTSSRVAETARGLDACVLLSKPIDADDLVDQCARLLRASATRSES